MSLKIVCYSRPPSRWLLGLNSSARCASIEAVERAARLAAGSAFFEHFTDDQFLTKPSTEKTRSCDGKPDLRGKGSFQVMFAVYCPLPFPFSDSISGCRISKRDFLHLPRGKALRRRRPTYVLADYLNWPIRKFFLNSLLDFEVPN